MLISTVRHLLETGGIAAKVVLTLNLGFSCQRLRILFTYVNSTMASYKSQ